MTTAPSVPPRRPGAPAGNTDAAQAELCLRHAVQSVFNAEYAHCPRSPEWKAGVLRGMRHQAGLHTAACPYPCATAQGDAWMAGNREGLAEWRHRAQRGLA